MEAKNNSMKREAFLIIKDQYKIQTSEELEKYSEYDIIEILKTNDYIEARKEIEKVKFLEGPPVLLWIRSKEFINAFADIEQVAPTEEIIPRERLSNLLNLERLPSRIKNETIVDLSLISNAEGIKESLGFIQNQSYQYSRNEDLILDALIHALLNGCPICIPFLKDQNTLVKIFKWLLEIDDKNVNKTLKNNFVQKIIVKRLSLFVSNVNEEYVRSFVNSLKEAIKNGTPKEFGGQILVLYLLRNYHSMFVSDITENLRDIVGPRVYLEHRERIFEVLEEELLRAYIDTSIDSRINDILKAEFNDIDELQVSDLHKYLKNCSGFFKIELRTFISGFTKEIYTSYIEKSFNEQNAQILINLAESKFQILLKKYESKDRILKLEVQKAKDILNLINLLSSISSRAQITTFEDWVTFYEEKVLRSDELVSKIKAYNRNGWCDKSYDEILKSYEKSVERRINEFENWLLQEFPRLLDLTRFERIENGVMLVIDVIEEIKKHLEDSKKIFFLVVDSLELRLWFLLRSVFISEGWEVEEEKRVLSLIPSDTIVSRRGLFGGDSLFNLEAAYREGGPEPGDEPAILARALNIQRDNILYENRKREFQRVIGHIERFQLPCFVYREHDRVKHRTEESYDVYLKAIEPYFRKLVSEFDKIKLEGYKIILATDHGSIETSRVKEVLPINKKYKKEGSGRYAAIGIYNTHKNQKKDNKTNKFDRKLVESYGKSCIVITGSELSNYGIPRNMKRVPNIVATIMAKGRNRFPWGKYPYTHGGLSFYETIIPFAILRKVSDEKILDPIVVRIKGEFTKDKKSRLEILLKNPNNTADIENVRIAIKELEISDWDFGSIPKSSEKTKEIIVIPKRIGEMQIGIEGVYMIRNNKKHFRDNLVRQITVKQSRKDRITKIMERPADKIFEEDFK